MILTADAYAVYLPAVNEGYAGSISRLLPAGRAFPTGLTLDDLVFWEPNALWYYPYLLHSAGLYKVGASPNNAVTQRNRANSMLLGDSGGFQIGNGTMKGLSAVGAKAMPATAAVAAWGQEGAARQWIVNWLSTYADYAMTIDMPLWASAKGKEASPFHNCSTQQLIDMTVNNLRYIERFGLHGQAKWLNVVQGGEDTSQIKTWWDAVKWFRHGGWAMAGSAGARGGLANMLGALLMMRDEGAFDEGQDWVHVLGVSTPTWAVLLTEIQQALQEINPKLRISFDSSSPFQHAGRYEKVALTPIYSSMPSSWGIGVVDAPQSRHDADPNSTMMFGHTQSPLGQRLQLNHLSIRDGIWDPRNFDSLSNMLLANHNVWVYLDAFKTANDLAAARDKDAVPAQHIECLDFIADVFKSSNWQASIFEHRGLLDAVEPSKYGE
jgi:hypothetical protein